MSQIPPSRATVATASTSTGTDYPRLAQQLRQKIKEFRDLLPPPQDELDPFAEATLSLDGVSRSASEATRNPSTRLMENVQNAAGTAQTVLNQPLAIDGTPKEISLVEAAKAHFLQTDASSDFAKVAESFSRYPEQTESLKFELQIIIDEDLKS
jgi:hypothetical protein